MATTAESLKMAMNIEGACGVALVDYASGMSLGSESDGSLDLEIAAAGNTEVVRAKQRVMSQLGLDGKIEDILITLEGQFHLIRPLSSERGEGLFLYLALKRDRANLAMARRELTNIERELEV